ncbi:hypothetical protein M514_04385 [Trichuris suis]|uniref:Uncharacterized protein n=1 Tax=Trichuris suis TaxID=68888 RepID=A0A085N4H7_9BILA|nr:hypothetical protein M513_04385 [Trichuris suis]KFD64373.1 hypothetical protein M514_04385 [Trichuris suis]
MAPHGLTQENKDRRVDCAMKLLTKPRKFAWLDHLISSHESWVLCDTPKRTDHSLRSGSAAPNRVKADGHQKKVLLCVW